jgi:hypothetical protein
MGHLCPRGGGQVRSLNEYWKTCTWPPVIAAVYRDANRGAGSPGLLLSFVELSERVEYKVGVAGGLDAGGEFLF